MFTKFFHLIGDLFKIFIPQDNQVQDNQVQDNQVQDNQVQDNQATLDELMVESTNSISIMSSQVDQATSKTMSSTLGSTSRSASESTSKQIQVVKGRDTLSADDLYRQTTSIPMAIPPEVSDLNQNKNEQSDLKNSVNQNEVKSEQRPISVREKMIQSVQETRIIQPTGRVIKPEIQADIKSDVKAEEMALIKKMQYQNQKSGSIRPLSESFAKNNINQQTKEKTEDPLKEHMAFLNELDNQLWDVKKSSATPLKDPKVAIPMKREAQVFVASKKVPMRVDATPYEKFWGTYSVSQQSSSFYFPSILRASKKIELDGWWNVMTHSANWDELEDDLEDDLLGDLSDSEDDLEESSEDESSEDERRKIIHQSKQLSVLEKNQTAELKHLLKAQVGMIAPWEQPRKSQHSIAPSPIATKQGKTLSAFAPVPLSAKTDVPIGTRLTMGPGVVSPVGKKQG
jgi:hypothetical protein